MDLDIDAAPRPDAMETEEDLDAGPMAVPISLTHSASMAIKSDHSLICQPDTSTPGPHHRESFYRVFDLSGSGVGASLEVEQVRFAIEQASSPSGSQQMRVRLHTLEGELRRTNLTLVKEKLVDVPNQGEGTMTVPLSASIEGSSTLVAELEVLEGTSLDNFMKLGMNDAGQTGPTFVQSDPNYCNVTTITNFADIGFGDRHLILAVDGKHLPE